MYYGKYLLLSYVLFCRVRQYLYCWQVRVTETSSDRSFYRLFLRMSVARWIMDTGWRRTWFVPGTQRVEKTRVRATPVVRWSVKKGTAGGNRASSAGRVPAAASRTLRDSIRRLSSICRGLPQRLEVSVCACLYTLCVKRKYATVFSS